MQTYLHRLIKVINSSIQVCHGTSHTQHMWCVHGMCSRNTTLDHRCRLTLHVAEVCVGNLLVDKQWLDELAFISDIFYLIEIFACLATIIYNPCNQWDEITAVSGTWVNSSTFNYRFLHGTRTKTSWQTAKELTLIRYWDFNPLPTAFLPNVWHNIVRLASHERASQSNLPLIKSLCEKRVGWKALTYLRS